MSTGSGFFAQLRQWFRLHFWASRPKDTKLTNLASSRYIKGENPSRSVDVRYTKTPLLKLPCVCDRLSFLSLRYAGLETTESLARICQMLPGNSSHPSLYPLLDSVPFSRPRVRLGPSCRTALWDCRGTVSLFYWLIKGCTGERVKIGPLELNGHAGQKKDGQRQTQLGRKNKEILPLERQFPFCSATHFVVCPPERCFCTV